MARTIRVPSQTEDYPGQVPDPYTDYVAFLKEEYKVSPGDPAPECAPKYDRDFMIRCNPSRYRKYILREAREYKSLVSEFTEEELQQMTEYCGFCQDTWYDYEGYHDCPSAPCDVCGAQTELWVCNACSTE